VILTCSSDVLLDVKTDAALVLYELKQRLHLRGRSVAIKHKSFTWQREEVYRRRRLVNGKISVAVSRVTGRVGRPRR